MAQRCPVCKTPLWTDPFFTPSRLRCPRCGAVFKSTVPWGYFRLLVLMVAVLCLFIISSLPGKNVWMLGLFLLGILIVFWYLPRLIDLQHVPGGLKLPEPLAEAVQLKLNLQDQEKLRFRRWIYFVLAVIAIFLLLALWGRS